MKPDGKDQYGEEQANRIAWLVAGFLRQTLSEKEHDELDKWVEADDDNQRLFEELIDPGNIEKGLAQYDIPNSEAALEKIKAKLKFTPAPIKTKSSKRRIIQYSIAASILLMAGLVIFFVINQKNDKPPIVQDGKQDIQAGGNRATLTLADGKIIDLANAKNGLIDSSNGPDVLKTAEGQLSYEEGTGKGLGSGKGSDKDSHVLTTPAGGQYSVTLPDGSRVWLNASSSLKYPVVFDEGERVVELTGEGYFEVARLTPGPSPRGEGGKKIPFIVKLKNGAQVEVVGTHFNINAYDDEAMIETTLLEGKVEVRGQKSEVRRELMPGEQASLAVSGQWSVVSGVDTSMAVAWKNGKFQFKDAPIETIMRQVARWYNAEIVYEGKVDFHFNATGIYRSEPLSKLLGVLEATENVHFSIEGRKVVVSP